MEAACQNSHRCDHHINTEYQHGIQEARRRLRLRPKEGRRRTRIKIFKGSKETKSSFCKGSGSSSRTVPGDEGIGDQMSH
ncbi:hypothetical protein K1719_001106 [Acacia pycnantha]|nr:hypothetical protein K1719_001106 [Acacia pycnantha]